MEKLFSENFSTDPYWWDQLQPDDRNEQPLPADVDVLIIGAGYTGLHTALQTARAGRHTLVIDAEKSGWGCSTRNGGQISTSLKYDYPTLVKKFGEKKGKTISLEGHRALQWIGQFVLTESIKCDFQVCGRFHAAHSAKAFEKIAASRHKLAPGIIDTSVLVPRDQQQQYIGSEHYHGGVLYPNYASLDPALYHRGLLNITRAAGAQVMDHCAAQNITRNSQGFTLQTSQGNVTAREIVIATNGYTGNLTPKLQRRVIPIGSYIIATEQLPTELITQLIPQQRIVTDSRKVVFYYRPSPDNTRILFGGRVSHGETDPRISAPALHRDLAQIFPKLREAKISHSWMGFVAYTFDSLPHIGQSDGLHYAMGYCGAGVSLSSYFGMKLGRKITGQPDADCGLDDIPHPTRPFYTGKPWFLAPSVRYYRWRDKHS